MGKSGRNRYKDIPRSERNKRDKEIDIEQQIKDVKRMGRTLFGDMPKSRPFKDKKKYDRRNKEWEKH